MFGSRRESEDVLMSQCAAAWAPDRLARFEAPVESNVGLSLLLQRE